MEWLCKLQLEMTLNKSRLDMSWKNVLEMAIDLMQKCLYNIS